MDLKIGFRNLEQETYFWHRERNGHFGGGFGNGKTYVACERAVVHLLTFSNYGMIIARQKLKVLRATTMKTFFKICPRQLIYSHDSTNGVTILINKSFVFWMHLDDADEQDIRGIEINSVLIDQGEEIDENIAMVLDARVGRWDEAKVPDYLLLEKVPTQYLDLILRTEDPDKRREILEYYTTWPRNKWGAFLVPNYFDVLSNPSEDDEFHWIYRDYHPNSTEKKKNHFHIERKTDDDMNDAATIERMKSRDSEWVDKYYYGKVGSPKALIHKVQKISEIHPEDYERDVFDQFIRDLVKRAALYRVLDHGDRGITAVGWEATLKGVHIFYREYYMPDKPISYHRQAITDLSKIVLDWDGKPLEEEYLGEYADPQIFKENAQKQGGFWSVAKEYCDSDEVDAPEIYWQRADNNEFATRNRISELLLSSSKFKHPITGETPAPGMYFICRHEEIYPFGVVEGLKQTKLQKRVLLGTVNGKNIYSEERDPKIPDHGYDYVRYDISMHNTGVVETVRKPPKRSFAYFNALLKRNPGFIPASHGKHRPR